MVSENSLQSRSRKACLVLSDHDLLYEIAVAKFDEVWPIKRTGDLATSNQRQAFHAFEICMFDHHYTLLGKKGFWVVVDQLSVYKAVDAVFCNGINFGFHFFL